MSESKFLIIWLAAPLCIPSVYALDETPPKTDQSPAAYWKDVFSGKHVPEFHFILSREHWDEMRPERMRRGFDRPALDRRDRQRPDRRGLRDPRPPEARPRETRSRDGRPGSAPDRSETRPQERRRQRSNDDPPRPPFAEGFRFPPRRGRRGPRALGGGVKYNYVKATMEVDGQRFDGVGLRFKGNSSYRASGDRPRKPFKVDTNRFIKNLKFHGQTKLNFSNAFKDPTYMKEKLGYEIYRAAGLPTPGVGWARLYLTVEGLYEKTLLGPYVLVEQIDEDFIEEHFGAASRDSLLMKPEGMHDWGYLGEDLSEYEERYDIKEGRENTPLLRRLVEFLKLLELGTDDDFVRQIGERLDLDGLARYLAATALMSSLDSYVGTPHNYYMLVDAADGKVKLLPWDLNESWATFTLSYGPQTLVRWDIERPWATRRRLLERLFAIESFKNLYLAKVKHLLATSFTEKNLFARTDALRAIVEPLLEDDPFGDGVEGMVRGLEGSKDGAGTPREEPSAFSRAFRPRRAPPLAIKPFIRGRIASVTKQLAGEEDGERLEGRRPPFGWPPR